jgi:hypothetical protein
VETVETKEDSKSQKQTAEPKTYEESYVKELIADRDKAKAKAREYAERDKKEAEAKAIEEGKLKELLAQKDVELTEARKVLEQIETARQARRTEILDKIDNAELKSFAEKLTTTEEIEKFLALVTDKKLTTHNANEKKTAPEAPQFKNLHEMMVAQNGGKGLVPKL